MATSATANPLAVSGWTLEGRRDVGFYRERIYPRLVSGFGDPPPIQALRRKLLPQASGVTLEIGVGPGANVAYYDPAKVTKVYALEPNDEMVRLAEARREGTGLDVEFLGLPGERIPLADASVDTVVSTFTLCTIPGVEEAFRGVRRVLRPGGRLVFFEIALSPDTPKLTSEWISFVDRPGTIGLVKH